MPTPTPHMNGGLRSKLPVLQSSTSSSFPTNLKRTNDELRQHISRLKAELEVEKAKSKQVHRDRVADIKKLKDQYDKEKLLAQTSTSDRVKTEHELEIKKLKESLQKEKEAEIKHILKFKDEELRTTKKIMAEDKDLSLKEQDERLRREFNCKSKDSMNETENKLRQELNECKKQRQQFEELYKQRIATDSEKSELLRKLKEDHEKENQRVLRDARIQIARNVHELKIAQKALGEKEQEIAKKEIEFTRLEEEKDQLLEKIRDKQNGEVPDTGTIQRTEKEWELQLKNMELKKNMDELIKKVNLLEKEASGGKSNGKDSDLLAKYEQRTKELRKRNGELVNLARKLEDKAKHLQEELKEVKSRSPIGKPAVSEPQSTTAFENFKKTYTMQRAKDLAEHAKVALRKDKEIAELKKRIADLEAALASSAGNVSEEKELEKIIRQIEKEKLQLEKQFAAKIVNEQAALNNGEASKLRKRIRNVEMENEKLEELVSNQKKDIEQLNTKAEHLNASTQKCEELQILLAGKEEHCTTMANELQAKVQACHELEGILADLKEKNMKIESENEKNTMMVTSLQNKLSESSKKLVQLENLEREYSNLQERLSEAENQCIMMQSQVEVFQEKVKNFRNLEEDLKQSEEKCIKWERDYDFAVGKINSQNREITELYEAQKSMKDSHNQEMNALKDEISRLEEICVDLESRENDFTLKLKLKEDELKSVKNVLTHHVYVQTSRPPTPVKADAVEEISQDARTIVEAEVGLVVDVVPLAHEKLDEDLLLDSDPSTPLKSDDDFLDIASSRIAALAVVSSSDGDFSRGDEIPSEKIPKNTERKANTASIPRDDAKMFIDNKKPIESGDTSDELSLSLDEMSDDGDNTLLNDNKFGATPKRSQHKNFDTEPVARKRIQFEEKHAPSDTSLPQADNAIANDNIAHQFSNAMQTEIDKLSVFIAKYTYDPFEHSPNDDPSLELALEAGDYVYVFGDADEDGFYTGELVDGQRGLVPSNFVEKIADENELISFSKGYESYPGDESDEDLTEVSWSCAESLTENEKDTPLDAEYLKVTPRPISTHSDNGGLNDDTDYDSGDELEKKRLSPPRSLKVERQLMNSVVISWLPPDDVDPEQIRGYSIRADGELKDTVIGSGRTKAIVSDINREKTCRITVHCLYNDKKEAEGSAAIITVGRGASAAPSDLHIFSLSATCADLEWTCGNSSMAHAVYLNGNEIHVVKPGTDRFKLTNLIPDHEFEVSVEARSQGEAYRKKSKNVELLSHCLIFRTPKAVPPEPPLNVQVFVSEPSPDLKEAFIYVSWLPVTIVDEGTSALGVVTGYRVYMNDLEVAFVNQPTEDHVKILARDFEEMLTDRKLEFIELWMRTQSVFGESTISNVVILPVTGLIDRITQHRRRKSKTTGVSKLAKDRNLLGESALHEGSEKLTNSAPERDTGRKNVDFEMNEKLADIINGEEQQATATSLKKEISTKDIMKEEKEATASEAKDDQRKDYRKLIVENDPKINVDIEKEGIKTKKATVIKYNVTESDESEDSLDENDSDDEDQCVFNILEEDHDAGTKIGTVENVQKKDDISLTPKESVPENLILPSLPIVEKTAPQNDANGNPPTDPPDLTDVKTRKHFPLDDMLSSSDSELSAIEEETIDDLLEYDKDGNSRPTTNVHNILNIDGSINKQSTDGVNMEIEKSLKDEKVSENLEKTFSIHSENDKNKTYSMDDKNLRTSSDKGSEKMNGQTSKDSLTFSSDDVIDLLDKDIMGNVPELPRDDDKELVIERENKKKPASALSSDAKRREPGIPVTDLADLSCDDDVGGVRAEEEQMREATLLAKPADASVKTRDEHIAVGSGDLPAKQTPVVSKGQNNIDALQLSREVTEDVSPADSIQLEEAEVSLEAGETESQTTTNKVAETTVEDIALENVVEDYKAEGVPKRIVSSDVVVSNVSNIRAEGEPGEESSMGQGISLNLSRIANDNNVGGDVHKEPDNDEQIKASLNSVHDKYSLNSVESSEDSEFELNPEYNPYFAPPTIEKSAEQENMGLGDDESSEKFGDDVASTLTEQPAIENGNLTERPDMAGIPSIEKARESNGEETRNNASINESERTMEDTRLKHVDEETKPNSVRVFIALFTYDPVTMSPNTEGVEEELAFTEGDLIKIFGECDEDGFFYGELHDRCGFVPSNMVQEVNLGNFGNSINIPPPEEECIVDAEESTSADLQQGSINYSQANSVASVQEKPNRKKEERFPAAQGARTDSLDKGGELNTESKKNTRKMDDIIANLGDIDIEDNNPDYRYISERNSIYCLPPTRMIALYDYDPAISSPNVDSEVELAFRKGDIILVFGDMDEDGFYAAQSHEERGLVPSNFLAECPELSDSEEIEIDIGAASPSIKTSSRKSSASSIKGASPVDSPKTKKKKGLLAKGKKIFSKLKGK